ncbi:MAG TPA: hypothetical protein DCG57_09595, partial [Candidatus Riflebacteria bacterium]|nr:hypothetical protein [Candidatus Riflebacteria bacterium]
MYLIYNTVKQAAKGLEKALTATYNFLHLPYKRNFSLCVFLLLGIFYPAVVFSVQIRQDSVTASTVYNASFSFVLGTHSGPRTHTVPARFYFTATDSEHVYNLSAGTTAFPAWATNYPAETWGIPSTISQASPEYNLFTQALQIASDSNSGLVRGALAVTRAKFSGEIEFATYAGTSNFLSSPNFTKTIATTVSPKSLSMMQSKAYLYFFWLDNDKIKAARKGSSKDFLPINTLTTPEIDNSIGLAGCTIVTASNQEYIALTYAKSNNTVNITTFTDSSDTPAGSQAILLKDNLGNPTSIDTTKVAIAHNQRNQKVTLTWTSGGKGYFAIYNFTPPATFIEHVGPSLIGSGFETSYGISVESYANFESTLVLPETTLKSYSLREPSTLEAHGSFGDPSYAIQFPFIDENNKYYAGLLGFAYSDYKFYRRELKFPDEGRWDKDNKILHIEGPPWPNTLVKIEYDF